MLRRFASGASVAAVAIACAAAGMLNLPILSREHAYPLVVFWLCVPAVWGVWAIVAPRRWTPHRLPVWGAVLGVLAAILGVMVLNLPLVVFGLTLSLAVRAVSIPLAAVLYYVLWMIVGRVYAALEPRPAGQERARAACHGGVFMRLELDAGEQEFLIQVLQRHQRELIWELARTDHKSFKSELREELRLLERLMDKAQVIELTVK